MGKALLPTWGVAGRTLQLTHLDKVYWPDVGVTKGDALRYYVRIAPTLLPHFRDRPVTMRLFPEAGRSMPASGPTAPRTGCATRITNPRRPITCYTHHWWTTPLG